uniref:hypothetical protein n=1 Tax=Salmonella sp. S146_54837 TaxID=2665635 RepID=UPI001CA963F3
PRWNTTNGTLSWMVHNWFMTLAEFASLVVTLEAMWTEHPAPQSIADRWYVYYIHATMSTSIGTTFLVYATISIAAACFGADATYALRKEIDRACTWSNNR